MTITANRGIESGRARDGHSAEGLELAERHFEGAYAFGTLAPAAKAGAEPDTRAVMPYLDPSRPSNPTATQSLLRCSM
jgi:hypothetical protein